MRTMLSPKESFSALALHKLPAIAFELPTEAFFESHVVETLASMLEIGRLELVPYKTKSKWGISDKHLLQKRLPDPIRKDLIAAEIRYQPLRAATETLPKLSRTDRQDPKILGVCEEVYGKWYDACDKKGKRRVRRIVPDIVANHDDLAARLAALGISKLPERLEAVNAAFATRVLMDLISNRENEDPQDTRPVAVVVYPKADHNNAYDYNPYLHRITVAYRVMYYEADSDQDMIDAIKQATKHQKASLVFLAGHGMQHGMAFGGGIEGALLPSVAMLDVFDAKKLKSIANRLAKNCLLVLDSCTAGAGRDALFNLANVVAKAIPHAWIFASTISSQFMDVELDKDNKVVRPIFSNEYDLDQEEQVYEIVPQG